jgi:predicted O-methyltransferase YrrM
MMAKEEAKLATLLSQAERHLSAYLERTGELAHESKGIRRSEMFFFYASVADSKPARIVESGRARAQSTLVLSKLFPQALIVSLESEAASPDVAVAAERLRSCRNVECRFGDSLVLLPGMVQRGDVVLIDGPKDFRALKLALGLLHRGKPAVVFVHDLWLGSPARKFVDRYLRSALLSDDPTWVQRYASLDSQRPMPPRALPNLRRAYGATLGRFRPCDDNYGLRLFQCRIAQGLDRIRETARKILRRSPIMRPADFQPLRQKAGR